MSAGVAEGQQIRLAHFPTTVTIVLVGVASVGSHGLVRTPPVEYIADPFLNGFRILSPTTEHPYKLPRFADATFSGQSD